MCNITVNTIPVDILREVLNYSPLTGVFTWVKGRGGRKAGSIAGYVHNGYTLISINSIDYYAQRLAYTYMYGGIPDEYFIDHINHDSLDNSIGNLRLVDISTNNFNRSNTLGYTYIKKTDKYQAQIQYEGKVKYLGSFTDEADACDAYVVARDGINIHGSSILSVFQVPISLDVGVRKKKTYYLNSNNVATTHHHIYNSMKKKFKAIVAKELDLRTIEHTDNYIVDYLLFLPDRLKRDVSNVCSVVQKFTDDAYVELGYATDDNYQHLQRSTYSYGGYDPNKKGFIQVTVRENNSPKGV